MHIPWLPTSSGVAGELPPAVVSPEVLAGDGSLRDACLTLEVEVSLSVEGSGALDSEPLACMPALSGVAGE